jgi:hypothetical protein
MGLQQSVSFRAERTSVALNRKFAGIIPAGVYYGFNIKPAGGMNISLEADEDYPANVAVIDRNGYSITLTDQDNTTYSVPSTGECYVCIQAIYLPDAHGEQSIVFCSAPEKHHVVLGKLKIPSGTTVITADMISEDGRTIGNPMLWLMDVSARFIKTSTEIMGVQQRITNLENWAKSKGFDPTQTYSGK